MQSAEFAEVFERVFHECETVLITKAKEYATSDRLHNFRTTAALKGETMEQALGGFMAKHTVSIYDMIASGSDYPESTWNEKITDHINYLILLQAILQDGRARDEPFPTQIINVHNGA